MEWINAFLCFRQQRVVVNGVKSDWAPVVSGVPQGTVLGPLLFSLYINDIPVGIDSQIRLFADDCVCYREIKTVEDTLKLQKDIDLLGSWARKWGMRFQPVKCNMMQLTNKRINKIEASYTLEGTVLEGGSNYHRPPQTTTDYHRPPQTTTDHYRLPQTMPKTTLEMFSTLLSQEKKNKSITIQLVMKFSSFFFCIGF